MKITISNAYNVIHKKLACTNADTKSKKTLPDKNKVKSKSKTKKQRKRSNLQTNKA